MGFPHNSGDSRKKGLSLRRKLCLNVNRCLSKAKIFPTGGDDEKTVTEHFFAG